MSYGTSLTDAYRQVGIYTGGSSRARSRPTCRSVQSTKFELVINLRPPERSVSKSADAARPRRRGDRMIAARVHHSARRRGGAWPLAARAQQERVRRRWIPGCVRLPRLAGHGSLFSCSGSANLVGPKVATSRSMRGRRESR